MTRETLLMDVDEAAKALREAQISLSAAIQRAYPIGTEIVAKIGAHKVTVKVSNYGANWSSPGELYGHNVRSGKKRQFHYTAIIGLAADE